MRTNRKRSRSEFGYLPETPPVYQELTVFEYLSFVGKLRGLSGADLTAGMERVMERLSLGPSDSGSSPTCHAGIASESALPKH